MKKLVLVIFALLMLCACNAADEPFAEVQHEANEYEEKWGLTLSVKDVTPVGAMVVFKQSGGNVGGSLETGSKFSIERYENGEWVLMEAESEIMWTLAAYLVSMEGETEMETNWEHIYGRLSSGTYRIGKEVSDFCGPGENEKAVFYAEFVIE